MRRFFLSAAITIVLLAGAAFYVGFKYPLRIKHPTPYRATGLLIIEAGRIYVSPGAAPLLNGTIVIRNGIIQSVQTDRGNIPSGAQRIDCPKCTVTAGWWNNHVHFTQASWGMAEWKKAPALQHALEDMLTSRGFTTVVDLGSNILDTIPLRRRIESGELAGPRIYTAGSGQYPPDGIPFYIRRNVPSWQLRFMPTPRTPAEAASTEQTNIGRGADVLKLFTGAYREPDQIIPMPVNNARAAVQVAHRHGQLAFAHESNLAGVRVALASGVDVLAHAVDTADGVDDTVLREIVSHHASLIPTLKMFATTVTRNPKYMDPIYNQVKRLHELNADLLFGTDVGYMRDYRTEDEFAALVGCGLNGRDILRMLTTAPATRFGVLHDTGTIETNKAADLVLTEGDPVSDPSAFTAVRTTIRSGRIIYNRNSSLPKTADVLTRSYPRPS